VKDGERAGHSLGLGLDGWKANVRDRLAQGQTPEEIARDFDLPVNEIEAVRNEESAHVA
jgi:hypothetical protein